MPTVGTLSGGFVEEVLRGIVLLIRTKELKSFYFLKVVF
jgi:hypothetical protein